MKIFRVTDGGRLQSAEMDDGVMPIAIGATLGADGKDHARITEIDYGQRVYWRGLRRLEFPERWLDEDGINALPWSDELAPEEN